MRQRASGQRGPLATRTAKSLAAALCAALLLSLPLSAAAKVDAQELEKQIGAFLSATYSADEPGATVIAVRDGKVVYRGAHGMADLELGVPLEPDMVLRLGSITKQFTAAAILLLEEQGKLSVDDPITEFLPDYPVHGHEITVAHLLSHTSGIRSYTGIPGWMQTKIKDDLTLEELIEGFRSEPMDFSPGERFLYNNSGYVLLGAIIEKASGKGYEEFIDEEIFKPLGMKASFYGNHDRIISRRAKGYDGGPGKYRNARYLSMSQPHAAGSLLSTVDVIATSDAAIYTQDLLSAGSLEKQVKPFALNDGESTSYAYGLMVGELRGREMIQHGGGIFGSRQYPVYRCANDQDWWQVSAKITIALIGYQHGIAVLGNECVRAYDAYIRPEKMLAQHMASFVYQFFPLLGSTTEFAVNLSLGLLTTYVFWFTGFGEARKALTAAQCPAIFLLRRSSSTALARALSVARHSRASLESSVSEMLKAWCSVTMLWRAG